MTPLTIARGRGILLSCAAALALILTGAAALDAAPVQSKKKGGGPETFRATAVVSMPGVGAANALVEVLIDTYTPASAIATMERALQTGGSPAFVEALRRAPIAGRLRVGEQTFTIRWARQRPTPAGRVISLVVDSPVYFVGAGVPGAKAREGFDVAVVQLTMDSSGVGDGTMAAAAKVKPGGATGVEIEDYASEPVKLTSAFKVLE